MRAVFDDLAIFHDEDAVGLLYGRQTMRNHEGCLACHSIGQSLLDKALVFSIERRGRLIQ